MKKRTALTAAVILTAALLTSGCDNIVLVPGKSSGTITEASSAPSEPLSAYPVVLNDTEIAKTPEKIVSLTPAYTEILFEMGYGDKIVAVSDYCNYPEAVEKLPKAASSANPDISAIKKLKPDLVITATPIVTKDKITLEAEGIKVLTITSPRTIEEFENIYKFFGLAFEGLFEGEAVGEKAFSDIRKQLDAIKKTDLKFVYITAASTPAGGDTFESAILSLFGTNCAKDSEGYSYKAGNLKDNQPDIIFVSDSLGEDILTSNKNYSSLTAVEAGNTAVLENKYFERPSARISSLLGDISAAFDKAAKPEEKPDASSGEESSESTSTSEPDEE